jgi:hypothetical protein
MKMGKSSKINLEFFMLIGFGKMEREFFMARVS